MIYKVSTRIETVQDGRRFDEEFRDGAGNSANPAECIFPIFQQNDSGLGSHWEQVSLSLRMDFLPRQNMS